MDFWRSVEGILLIFLQFTLLGITAAIVVVSFGALSLGTFYIISPSRFNAMFPRTRFEVGDKIPSTPLKEHSVLEADVNLATIPGKIIIVGVPGAFTPTCSIQVPSYYENAELFKQRGIQGIYIVCVNDAFIMQAWKKTFDRDMEGGGASGAEKIIHFLADDTGEWTREARQSLDMSDMVGGVRSKRYAAVVEDGILRHIFVEEDASAITASGAEEVLKDL